VDAGSSSLPARCRVSTLGSPVAGRAPPPSYGGRSGKFQSWRASLLLTAQTGRHSITTKEVPADLIICAFDTTGIEATIKTDTTLILQRERGFGFSSKIRWRKWQQNVEDLKPKAEEAVAGLVRLVIGAMHQPFHTLSCPAVAQTMPASCLAEPRQRFRVLPQICPRWFRPCIARCGRADRHPGRAGGGSPTLHMIAICRPPDALCFNL
jgi:hypothetical protein